MKRFFVFALFALWISGCGTVATLGPQPATASVATSTRALVTSTPRPMPTPVPSSTATATVTVTVTARPSVTPSPTRDYPAEGYGPKKFPENINPLTGLKVATPAILNRRPMIVKVSNLPRNVRPQWGLSLADHVYEYYTEEGSTRFAAVFYGQDAKMVGPIRSGRFLDNHLVVMYKANFAFGSADYRERNLFYNQNYADRLVTFACPPNCRYEPNGVNYLVTNTVDLTKYIDKLKVPGGNGRQNLDGLLFREQTPGKGAEASQVFVRYSGGIYNRWDYDPQTGKYLRFSETVDDVDRIKEVYAPLMDRLTDQPVSADNVVVLYVSHQYFSRNPEIVDIVLSGPDKAYLFRDGQMFQLTWYRNLPLDQLFILVGADGKPFPLKPGNTFFQVVGSTTSVKNTAPVWRFTFSIP